MNSELLRRLDETVRSCNRQLDVMSRTLAYRNEAYQALEAAGSMLEELQLALAKMPAAVTSSGLPAVESSSERRH